MDAYTCPRCGKASAHPTDTEERYCGRCHTFADVSDMWQHYARVHEDELAEALRDAPVDGPLRAVLLAEVEYRKLLRALAEVEYRERYGVGRADDPGDESTGRHAAVAG